MQTDKIAQMQQKQIFAIYLHIQWIYRIQCGYIEAHNQAIANFEKKKTR